MNQRGLLRVAALAVAILVPCAGSVWAGDCQDSCGAGSCTFRGLLNEPLGNASLSINEACHLVVDEIGGGGNDGVVQTTLQSQYMKTTLATPNLSQSATGTRVRIRQVGVAAGEADRELMVTEMVNFNGLEIRHSVDCSAVFVDRYTMDVFNDRAHVGHVDLGIDPPVLLYPKTDLVWMACGLRPNGDLYTVFRLGSAQPIGLQGSMGGPLFGDLVVVFALTPQDVPTLQTDIENTFFATGGPITLASVEAGPAPGVGPPCPGDCSSDLAAGHGSVRSFLRRGWKALRRCSRRGEPACPVPCPEYPTLEESGVRPSCYNLLGCYLDGVAGGALSGTWGANRCPSVRADRCDRRQGAAAGKLLGRALRALERSRVDRIPKMVEACHRRIARGSGGGCDSGVCDVIPLWAAAIIAD